MYCPGESRRRRGGTTAELVLPPLNLSNTASSEILKKKSLKLEVSEKIEFENFEREFHELVLDDLYKEIEEQRKMEELT